MAASIAPPEGIAASAFGLAPCETPSIPAPGIRSTPSSSAIAAPIRGVHLSRRGGKSGVKTCSLPGRDRKRSYDLRPGRARTPDSYRQLR